MNPPNCYARPLRSVWHRLTGNKAQPTQPERVHQTTDRSATQPPSPDSSPRIAAYTLETVSFQPPSLSCVSQQKYREVERTVGANRQQSKEIQHPPKRTTPEWSHAAVACMADGQPSALGKGRHPGSETSAMLPGEQNLYVLCNHMRSQPYHDELHTFRRETERRRHCGNEGWICAVAESRCRHDMVIFNLMFFHYFHIRQHSWLFFYVCHPICSCTRFHFHFNSTVTLWLVFAWPEYATVLFNNPLRPGLYDTHTLLSSLYLYYRKLV